MTPPPPAAPAAPPTTGLGAWLGQRRALLALLRQGNYRRDAIALEVTALRGAIGLPFLASVVLFALAGGFLLPQGVQDPRLILEGLLLLTAGTALAAGATLYQADREAGLFELLWLATGSERALLAGKLRTRLVLLAVPVVIGLALAFPFLAGKVSFGAALVCLMVTGWVVLAFLALLGTVVPGGAWASGLAGAGALAGIHVALGGAASVLQPFLNPLAEGAGGKLVVNRVLFAVLGFLMVRAAERRLRRAM